MYLNLHFGEIENIKNKLKSMLFIKELEKNKKYLNRIKKSLKTNKFVFNDSIDLKYIEDMSRKLDMLKYYNVINSEISIDDLKSLINSIILVKYIKKMLPSTKHKYISIKNLNDDIYVYNLLRKYGDMKLIENVTKNYEFIYFNSIYAYIDDIVELLKNKDLIIFLNKVVKLLKNENKEKLYSELLKLSTHIQNINELIKIMDCIGDYTNLLSYILKETTDYTQYLKDIVTISNLSLISKYVSLDRFKLLNSEYYDVNIIQNSNILEPIYDISDIEFLLKDILKVIGYDPSSLYTWNLENKEYMDFILVNSEDEIEDFKDNYFLLFGIKIPLSLSSLNDKQLEEFESYCSRLIDVNIGDYGYYDIITNIEENYIKLIISDGCFFNTDFLDSFINILLLCKKGELCLAS